VSILNPLFDAVAWVMMRIHAGLAVPFGASSGLTWGLSIVILVVLMRLVMVPLFIKQRNSMQKMQSHMPQLAELRKKYKNDKQKLNEETMKFYKENGINPLGGCLPLVAQLPVFWSLFNVLKAIAQWTPPAAGQVAPQPKYGMTIPFVESAHSARIFGISLYDQFLHPAAGESLTSRLLIVVFVLVSAATTFLTMRQSQKRGMMNQTAPDPDQPGAAAAQAMSKNMMYIAPFFALTGLYWQFGLVLYWVTTNVWTLGQQHFLFRNLPIVGSTTVGASATQAASGNSGSAKSASSAAKAGTASAKTGAAAKPGATARAGTAPRAGTAARTGTARTSTAARTGAAPKAGTAPKTGTKSAADAKPANPAKPVAKNGTSGSSAEKAPAVNGNGAAAANGSAANGSAVNGATVHDAAVNGNGNGNGAAPIGAGLLRRFGKKEEPQDDVPVAPQTKVVRQQPVRQTRSRRGNTGKR
jgi:YidC/Oxa1 family membrane protein insertase